MQLVSASAPVTANNSGLFYTPSSSPFNILHLCLIGGRFFVIEDYDVIWPHNKPIAKAATHREQLLPLPQIIRRLLLTAAPKPTSPALPMLLSLRLMLVGASHNDGTNSKRTRSSTLIQNATVAQAHSVIAVSQSDEIAAAAVGRDACRIVNDPFAGRYCIGDCMTADMLCCQTEHKIANKLLLLLLQLPALVRQLPVTLLRGSALWTADDLAAAAAAAATDTWNGVMQRDGPAMAAGTTGQCSAYNWKSSVASSWTPRNRPVLWSGTAIVDENGDKTGDVDDGDDEDDDVSASDGSLGLQTAQTPSNGDALQYR